MLRAWSNSTLVIGGAFGLMSWCISSVGIIVGAPWYLSSSGVTIALWPSSIFCCSLLAGTAAFSGYFSSWTPWAKAAPTARARVATRNGTLRRADMASPSEVCIASDAASVVRPARPRLDAP